QVRSSPAGSARPSGCEPVKMSWRLGVSPRPFTDSPFSLSAVGLLILLPALCRSSTLWAIASPLAFCHGPRPIRSRALMAGAPPAPCVLRYARQVRLPAPAACASDWQCRSAPSMPPRSPPLPGPALVMKNVMLACCARETAVTLEHTSATDATMQILPALFIPSPPVDRVASLSSNRWACQRKHRHAPSERCRDTLASLASRPASTAVHAPRKLSSASPADREYWRMSQGGYNVPTVRAEDAA